MARFCFILVLAALLSAPFAPARAGGEPSASEEAALRAALDSVRATADRLAELVSLYLRERRMDEARRAVQAVADLAEMEKDLAGRLAALAAAAAPPPPPALLPPPAFPVPLVPPAPPKPPPHVRLEPRPAPELPATAPGDTLAAVRLGLGWLARHQDEDGKWDPDGFVGHDKVLPVCDGPGNALYEPGLTGLALLAFLGSGQTHKHGEHREAVRRALLWLKSAQDPDGCFGQRVSSHFTYNHAIAALACVEAFGLTASPLFKESAQRGLDFIESCRNPYLAWRYGVRPQDNDTSVSGWMTLALAAGKTAGLRVEEEAFQGMRAWLDKVTDPDSGRVGYTARGTGPARPMDRMDRFPAEKSESLTAVGIHSRLLMGEDAARSEPIRMGAALLLGCLPAWDDAGHSVDFYYWYHGTLAASRLGGETWTAWSAALTAAILPRQRKDSESFAGSWDPADAWGADGGRIYSTALLTLCAEMVARGVPGAPDGPR